MASLYMRLFSCLLPPPPPHQASETQKHSSHLPPPPPRQEEVGKDRAVYDLTAVVCHVSDPKFPDKNNLVSVVRVGPGYHQRAVGSAVSQWYIFNDLGVTPVSRDEAVWLPLQWKVRPRKVVRELLSGVCVILCP